MAILLLSLFSVFFSCNNDDDVCLSGEATPRLKIKFKSVVTGKLKTLDTLYVYVDYGNGKKTVIDAKTKVDSVLIPMRVDDKNFTDIFVKTTKAGDTAKIKMTYTTESQYVSPPCGIKKIYYNVASELITPEPVIKVEQNQTQIINEDKTTLYLDF